MDSLQKLVEWLLGLGGTWPDVSSICIGTVSGWSIATVIEFLLSGNGFDSLKVKKVMVVSTVLFSWVFSVLMWTELDPVDSLKSVVIVCGVLASISPLSYVIVARIASKYVPWINSLWAINNEASHGNESGGKDPT